MKLTVSKLLVYLETGYNKVYLDKRDTGLPIQQDNTNKGVVIFNDKPYILQCLVDKLNSFTEVEFSREVKETVVYNKPVTLEITEEELRDRINKAVDGINELFKLL